MEKLKKGINETDRNRQSLASLVHETNSQQHLDHSADD